MFASLMPINLYAMSQNSPLNLEIAIYNSSLGDAIGTVEPDVTIRWDEPDIDTSQEDSISGFYYGASLTDQRGDTSTLEIVVEGEEEVKLNSANGLKNGKMENGVLYRIDLRAYYTYNAGTPGDTSDDFTLQSTALTKYFITDFDTQVTGYAEELEITWEYIEGMDYLVRVEQGDYSSKEDFPGTDSIYVSEATVIDSVYRDQSSGRERVSYTIANNIIPGQIYSVYVEPYVPPTDSLYHENIQVGTSPEVVSVITEIPLTVTDTGNNAIQLTWTVAAGISTTAQGSFDLVRTLIWETPSYGGASNIFTFYGTNGAIGYYNMTEPTSVMTYQLQFYFQNSSGDEITAWSNAVEYTPYELAADPTSPRVPDPVSVNTEVAEADKSDYLVTGDNISVTDADFDDHIFTVLDTTPLQIQLVWDAPTYVDEYGDTAVDYDIKYDIWVTDDIDELTGSLGDNGLEPTYSNIYFLENEYTSLILDASADVIGFKTAIYNYYNSATNTTANLTTNRTYYIQIVAKSGSKESDPTLVAITIDKDGDIFQPPVLGKPPLQVKEDSITLNSGAILWRDNWYEVMAKNTTAAANLYLYDNDEEADESDMENYELAQRWNVDLYLDGSDPAIYFKNPYPEITTATNVTLLTAQDLIEAKAIVEYNAGESFYDEYFVDRAVSLGENISYEIKVTPYETIKNSLSADQSFAEWIEANESTSTDGWTTVNPSTYYDADGLDWMEYEITNLDMNTSYVVMIRAYRTLTDGSKEMQSYPSYVIFNTLTEFESDEEIPTVPILSLNEEETTDISFEVFWKYDARFDYELIYGRTEDTTAATVVDIGDLDDTTNVNFTEDGSFAYITISGLFPDTGYYAWLRAKQKVGDEVSAWSSPVYTKTLGIDAPDAPTALGPAAYLSIVEAGYDYEAIGSDYIVVEWTKNPDDQGYIVDGSVTKEYNYVVELADNVEFIDSVSVTTTDFPAGEVVDEYSILAKNLVQFNELNPNKPYYVKVKTVLTITDSESTRVISEESDYTDWVRIYSDTSSDEYDGGDYDNIIVYPYDVEENFSSAVWDYEILNTQGIITQLLNKEDSTLSISVDLYRDTYDAVVRNVKIPYALLNTLANRNMNLEIETAIATYEIDPRGMSHYTQDLLADDNVVFSFHTILGYDLVGIDEDYPFMLDRAEAISVGVESDLRYHDDMTHFSEDYQVSMNIDEIPNDSNIKMHTYNYATADWDVVPHTVVDTRDESLAVYETKVIGINSLYYTETFANAGDMTNSLKEVSEKYGVAQIGMTYFADSEVTGTNFANMLLGIIYDEQVVNVDQTVTEEQFTQLGYSGIYDGSATDLVTQQELVDAMARLYELETGYPNTSYDGAFLSTYIFEFEPTQIADFDDMCDLISLLGL